MEVDHQTEMRFVETLVRVCACVLMAGGALAASVGPSPGQIKNLVTFGDSYTDVVSSINSI